MAIGSDVQWRRLTAIPKFAAGRPTRCAPPTRAATSEREAIHRDMAAVTGAYTSDEIAGGPARGDHSATRIHDIRQVRDLPPLRDKLTRTTCPMAGWCACSRWRSTWKARAPTCRFRPSTARTPRRVLGEAGYSTDEVEQLRGAGVIA